jgi:translation initiation factor IF-3
VNEQIRIPKVRLIDEDGSQVGITPVEEALRLAYSKELDLVEVAPNAVPPVCRIMDFGKYKYQLEISEKEKKKKQTQIVIKEIKLRPKIDKNDLGIKTRQIEKFLQKGNKVKVTMSFKGREIIHSELGMNLLNNMLEELGDSCIVEQRPKLEGYNIIMILEPA